MITLAEINCNHLLFSVHTDGNLQLNFAIVCPYEHWFSR